MNTIGNKAKKESTAWQVGKIVPEYLKPGTRGKANITSVQADLARNVFGENARQPDSTVLIVEFEGPDGVFGTANWAAPGLNPGDSGKDAKVLVSPKSSLGKFINMYGSPEPGLAIDCAVNDAGYWAILLP